MILDYAKVALRHVRKRKGLSFINVMGLAIGMACCLLITLYVYDEWRFDAFHEDADRIFRVVTDIERPTGTQALPTTSGAVAPALLSDFPDVESAVRLTKLGFFVYRADDTGQPLIRFNEDNLLVADSTFFDLFTFSMLAGNPKTALNGLWNVVLTESTARRYFGEEPALGQTLVVEDMGGFFPDNPVFTVTGVIADVPTQSHLDFDLIIPMAAVQKVGPPGAFINWMWTDIFSTYIRTQPSADPAVLEAQLADYAEAQFGDAMEEANQQFTYGLEPLRDIYLRSTRGGFARMGSLANLYIFAGIAMFILFMAGINFINLATARSAERAKEIGLRKVVGARRRGLISQFLLESIFLAVAAMLVALVTVEVSLPAFERLTSKQLTAPVLTNTGLVVTVFLLAVGVGIAAGAYPALVLTRFDPIVVLRGTFTHTRKGVWLRKSLVVFQFSLATMLLAGTFIVMAQVSFMRDQALGFSKGGGEEQLISIAFDGDPRVMEQLPTLKQELLRHPHVQSVSSAVHQPGGALETVYTEIEDADRMLQGGHLNSYIVDADYLQHYGLALVAGRFFSEEQAASSHTTLVVNEAVVRLLGYAEPSDILGKTYRKMGQEGMVIGVVKDFHYRSLQEDVKPLTLSWLPQARFVSVRVPTDELPLTLAALEKTWTTFAPHIPFNMQFLDETYNQQYAAEERFGQIFRLFAVLAMGIACLGLFGLASLTIQQRTKEIGIRKVLGASVQEVVLLLTRSIWTLVGWALLVAIPVVYLLMSSWLDTFAYRITLSPLFFVQAGGVVLLIAAATVVFQTIRAAQANPVEALRYE